MCFNGARDCSPDVIPQAGGTFVVDVSFNGARDCSPDVMPLFL